MFGITNATPMKFSVSGRKGQIPPSDHRIESSKRHRLASKQNLSVLLNLGLKVLES